MSLLVSVFGFAIVAFVAVRLTRRRSANEPPVVGGNWPILGHAVYLALHPSEFIAKCREEYGDIFTLATPGRYITIICSDKAREIIRLPDRKSSFHHATDELMRVNSLFGNIFEPGSYHFPLIRTRLTAMIDELNLVMNREMRRIIARFLEQHAGKSCIPGAIVGQDSYTDSAHCLDHDSIPDIRAFVEAVISETVGIALVGEQCAKDSALLDSCRHLAHDFTTVMSASEFLPSFIAKRAPAIMRHRNNFFRVIIPEVLRRREMMDNLPEQFKRPADFLQVLVESRSKDGDLRAPEDIALRLMHSVFASVHTTVMTCTQTLCDVVGRQTVRERLEQEQIDYAKVNGSVTTRAALDDMPFLDAVVRESMRFSNLSFNVVRRAMTDITLRDGTFIPEGRVCAVSAHGVNCDYKAYGETHNAYLPERHLESPIAKASSAGPAYVIFGGGSHVCPGRFFAINQIKLLVSILLREYEIRTESGKRPKNVSHLIDVVPLPEKVIMKRRAMPLA
ncbi:cytochrome P450 [Thamnocephalis sphaerospora]|uniref:Cytochrome P450 n=1 Tax=Thamnocephalis sphaerospora TaxID=78915 RepID=A0A4P9XQZ9_9FUNG|nr:cytochrome P450 [Thamnocephalis sphaerospora]|eukprot:RKP08493.1 cytochrome P450 [Thamnocephalis sphaerospora]